MTDLSSYRFTQTHEWVRREGDDAVVGITDHAQSQLGDVIFLDLPAVGTVLAAGERFGTVESVKAASDLYCPVGGTVAAINEKLSDSPETVNSDPYTDGWMLRLSGVDDAGSKLIGEEEYRQLAGE